MRLWASHRGELDPRLRLDGTKRYFLVAVSVFAWRVRSQRSPKCTINPIIDIARCTGRRATPPCERANAATSRTGAVVGVRPTAAITGRGGAGC